MIWKSRLTSQMKLTAALFFRHECSHSAMWSATVEVFGWSVYWHPAQVLICSDFPTELSVNWLDGFRCDRHYDCTDGSDEQNCGKLLLESASMNSVNVLHPGIKVEGEPEVPSTSSCDESEFRCVQDGRCIPSSDRCNRRYDCSDASDEAGCGTAFPCTPYLILLPETSLIAFVEERERPAECSSSEFQCEDKLQCIPESQRCDRQYHCRDGSDEFDCSSEFPTFYVSRLS